MTPGSSRVAEVAWAAGFFDGEGSVFAKKNHGGRYVHPGVAVYQSSRDGIPEELGRFARAVEADHRRIGVTRGHEWQFRVQGHEAVRVLSLLWPHLSSKKRAKALLVISRSTSSYAADWIKEPV